MAIVKVTHRCNLACTYCYEKIESGRDMPLAVFKTIATRIAGSSRAPRVTFVLHGGEPSLLSRAWLKGARRHLDVEQRIFGKELRLSMQTNIIALSETKLKFLQEIGCGISASLDGPDTIADPLRQQPDRAAANYGLARSLGIRVGVLTTINGANWDKFGGIMRWLHRDLGVQSFKANVVSPVGAGRDTTPLRADQVLRAYSDILAYMIANDGAILEDNMLLELERFFDGRDQARTQLCREFQCGAGARVIGVNKNGDILPCGRFEWSESNFYLGSLLDESEDQLDVYRHRLSEFFGQAPENWMNCRQCDAQRICSYGCQAFIVRSKVPLNVECGPTKLRYRLFVESAEALRPLYEIAKRRLNHGARS